MGVVKSDFIHYVLTLKTLAHRFPCTRHSALPSLSTLFCTGVGSTWWRPRPNCESRWLEDLVQYNSFTEWYQNILKFDDGPTRQYHNETYGADFEYESME
jgi:hypothetical protein